jgi:valyl-tRNA synthetase
MLDKSFDFKKAEAELSPLWEKSGLFAANVASDKNPFTIMMPPPNVSGALHVGHALGHTLQDIQIRYNRMKGKDALWMPGTDHASIVVDMLVTRQLEAEGLSKKDVGRTEFLKRAWKFKEESGGTITSQLRKLGTTPDWERERFTMDDKYMKAVIHIFVKMYNDGLIYRDQRLVNWDPKLKTSISDIEVEHKDVKGKLYHVKYMFEDGSGHISIATTRPETILADGAIAVHPDDDRFKHLVGKFVVVPVCNRIIPIIADDYVKMDFGSGAVKITAAHDYNDFEVYKRHKDKGIPLINLMNPDGTMNENCPKDYIGLDRFAARTKIVADLDELEYLEKIEDHTHQVPYGDRSGVVIEPYMTDQWYCDAQKLGVEALKAVEDGRTEFVPKQWENTYYSWMRNLEPWCISRQLWWGYQIPAWYGPDEKVFVAENSEKAQELAEKHYGHKVELRQDEDILDTWFSSGLWPFATLGWPEKTPELEKYYPGDVLVTGFDIIFFWVARMMMMGLYAMGDVPFKKVYIHGLVRDAKGQKMSKSKGNVLNPLDLTEKYGADALRFTLCALSGQGRDIKLSEQRLEGYRNFSTKLWNAARYCEMNNVSPVDGFNPQNVKHPLNQWIIDEMMHVIASIDQSMDQFRFNDAANGLYHFVWGTFCDWYLEFTKPIMNGEADAETVTETKATTAWVLGQTLKILNPFMPFVTEVLYKDFFKTGSTELLFGQDFPESKQALMNPTARAEISGLQRVITEIRSVRMDMNVPASAKLDILIKGTDKQSIEWLRKYEALIFKMARIQTMKNCDVMPKGAIQIVIGEMTLGLPVADIINLDQERARLAKELDKLKAEIASIDGRLSNEGFVAKAPEDVIEEQKIRREEAELIATKLSLALKQLDVA